MTLADTLRGLVRRWYIVVPGLLLAVAAALGAFSQISPAYERSATRLLLPGLGTVPEGATNPYLFLGGLTQATDVLVRAVGGDETVGELVAAHEGMEVAVTRDPTSSGPVIQLTVTADSDAEAAMALDVLIEQSTETLERLQTEQNVRPVDRITLTTLTASTEGALQQRTRIVISAAAGLAVGVLTLAVASLVDGLARRKRARAGDDGAAASTAADGGARDDATDNDATDNAGIDADGPDADGPGADGPGADAPSGAGGEGVAGPADNPADHPAAKPADHPAAKPADNPAADSAGGPAEAPPVSEGKGDADPTSPALADARLSVAQRGTRKERSHVPFTRPGRQREPQG